MGAVIPENKNIGPSLKNGEVYHDLTSAAV